MAKRALQAFLIGTIVTFAFFGVAFVSFEAGYEGLGKAAIWQNALLQALAPLHNIGTPENPVYEGTPLNFLAFFASVPLGILVYSLVAYTALRLVRQRT